VALKSEMFRRELIEIDMEAKNTDDFFEQMAKKLSSLHYVEDTFENAIKERESKYPTALPIQPFAVAIPHTDCEHIKKPFIAPVRLKEPVKWCEMAANDVVHDVRFVFMLGIKEAHQQVDLLQNLVMNFQDEGLMKKLEQATSIDEYEAVLMTMKGLEL